MPKPQGKSTRLKRPSPPLWDGRSYADAIIETVREPLLVLDSDLRVKLANRSFYQTFRVSPQETKDRLIYELGGRQWDIPKLRRLLEEILPQDGQVEDFEVEHDFPEIGCKIMLLNARRLRHPETDTELILLAIEDITERKREEEEMTALKDDALEKRVEELDAFTYSVSHDLKEPLRALEAFSQFLLEDCADRLDEQGRDYLIKIANASIRMKNLVDELLTLSRASRRLGPPVRVDVDGLVGETIEGIHVINARGAALAVEKGLPDVLAEPVWLKEVFANLIGNAVKFNKSELPHVNIGVRAMDGGMATFYVQDNGIGIDPQYHERIFGMFERLNRREEYEGTGAGLAIVKRVLENLGGKVWVESELGAGATFLFTLPVWAEATASTEEQAA